MSTVACDSKLISSPLDAEELTEEGLELERPELELSLLPLRPWADPEGCIEARFCGCL